MVTGAETSFIKQICAAETPPSLGQRQRANNVLCAAQEPGSANTWGMQVNSIFPLQRPKKFLLNCFLCVFGALATGARMKQPKTQSRANQRSVLEVSSKEAPQSIVWSWCCSLWFWDTFSRKTRVSPQNVVSVPTSLQLTADMQSLSSWPGQGIVIFY